MKNTICSLFTASLAISLAASLNTQAASYSFLSGSEAETTLNGNLTGTLDDDSSGQLTVSTLSDLTANTFGFGGGGGSNGVGMDSNGGNSAQNGSIFEYFANNGTTVLSEGFAMSFLQGTAGASPGTATAVELGVVSFAEFDTGETISIQVGGSAAFDITGGVSSYDFSGTQLASGETLSIRAAAPTGMGVTNTDWRLTNMTFTVVPEPSSTALIALGGLALALRKRR